MVGAVPAVAVVEDLVPSRLSFELDDVYRLDPGSITGGRASVNRLDGHELRKEIELTHDASTRLEPSVAFKLMLRCASFLRCSSCDAAPTRSGTRLPDNSPTLTATSPGAPLLEVCIETLPEALQAVEAGAQRLEVCAAMSESGTTPSIGLVAAILEKVDVPVFVMIRPRGGDFTYDGHELDVMRRDIEAMKRAGAHGIVSGALEPGGDIDRDVTRTLVDSATPLPFTFHRAFDLAPALENALSELRSLGVRRVLTSGGASTALVGAGAIAKLARQEGERNSIMLVAGGAVRASHVAELIQRSGVSEVHARPTRRRSRSSFARRGVEFGASVPLPERAELDPDAVRALVSEMRAIKRGS